MLLSTTFFFFCILFVYCFIKLNIELQQRRNVQHKKEEIQKRLQFTSLENIQFNITNFNYKVTGYKITGFTKANNLGILQQCDI